jgi:hypothetical protein
MKHKLALLLVIVLVLASTSRAQNAVTVDSQGNVLNSVPIDYPTDRFEINHHKLNLGGPGTLTLGGAGTNNTFAGSAAVIGATADLYLKDLSTGFIASVSGIVNLRSGNALRSTTFTSGVRGWEIDDDGNIEANNVRVRGEIAASVFKIGEITATAGTTGVFYSASKLSADATTPASTGSTFTFTADNAPSGGMLLGAGSVVRMKAWSGGAVADVWATITGRTNNGLTTTYTSTLNSGSTSTTFTAGTAVIDYGVSGTGFITQSADGTLGASPNLTMATHAGSPWSAQTTLLRLGNLNGSYGYATNVYGLGIGDYNVGSWLTMDPVNGLTMKGGGGNVLLGATGLSLAATTSYNTNAAIKWMSGSSEVVRLYETYVPGSGGSLSLESRLAAGDANAFATADLSVANDGPSKAVVQLLSYGSNYVNPPDRNASAAYIYAPLGTFKGLAVGSASAPITHMLDVYGTGWFQNTLQVNNAPISANYTFTAKRATNQNIGLGQQGGEMSLEAFNDAMSAGVPFRIYGNPLRFGGTLQLLSYGAGTLTTDASGNVTASSDERLKDLDGDFTRGLADLRAVQPRVGRYKDSTGMDRTEQYVWAATAQNLLESIPEAVSLAEDDTYTVANGPVIATLINAVKELDASVRQLRSENDALLAAMPSIRIHPTPHPVRDTTDRKALAAQRDKVLRAARAQRRAAAAKQNQAR